MNTNPGKAKNLLLDLLDTAKSGSLHLEHLPGQIEAILETINMGEVEQAPASTISESDHVQATRAEDAEFLKIAIHELRTPLTSIRGYADMMANTSMAGELSDTQSQLLEVVRNNIIRMDCLLNDMSLLNKIRGGILQVNKKMDLFKNIAQIAEKEVRALTEALNRALEFDIAQGLPLLNTDGELFAIALSKLIENGLRYSPEGSGKVIVRGRGQEGTLMVTIEDNGIGMMPDELDQLGTLFFRADHKQVRSYKGSGVGVAIAYGLLRLIEGDVRVESIPGEGTRFMIQMAGLS